MKLNTIIRKVKENTNLSVAEQNEQNTIKAKFNTLGINPSNAYNIQRKPLKQINFPLEWKEYDYQKPFGNLYNDNLLNRCNYFTNIKSNIAIPFVKTNNVLWGETPATNDTTLTDVKLKPKRLSTYCDIPISLELNNDTYTDDVANLINQAVFNKAVSTMFSTYTTQDTDKPKGLFSLVESNEPTETNLKAKVNQFGVNGYNGVFVFSPSAFINTKFSFSQYFDNNTFLGFEYLIDSRVQYDYFAFIDFEKVVFGDWTINSITIDKITKVILGLYTIVVDSYCDFNILDSNAIAVFKYDDSNGD